ncbi:twitching motility protein PilT [Clostridium aceticum]|uniref:type IV pilus twitching motility protein PilT n=1 Tax=Clostridium aceticum TaxID=84022 RepID=UPI0005CF8D8E|nr:type IV pilus twitching motility protein PilT [Clostridium aceticum]KJF26939.1 twitching motility protein PilT [Clostridium aceticum]
MLRIEDLLHQTKKLNGSDLHLTTNAHPMLRVNGKLEAMDFAGLLCPESSKNLLYQVLTPQQVHTLESSLSVDLAIAFDSIGRFRINAYYQRGAITSVFRSLADNIPLLESLGLPQSVFNLPDLRNGLVLVTGTTGSGKSTTLAAIIDRINKQYKHNIITVEDPIEYIHQNIQSIVNQRELHADVDSFADALRSALRADPDVILVGEMRDLETIRTVIRAAETGHLVFSTLHSRDAASSINRIIGVFPPDEQSQIRQQLSSCLKAVISQQLLPKVDGTGRVLASEVMMVTPAIGNLIRLGKPESICQTIETSTKLGMQTMDQCLEKLVKNKVIDAEIAMKAAVNHSSLEEKIGQYIRSK